VFEGAGSAAPTRGKARLEAEVLARGKFGLRTLRFSDAASLARNLERIGHVPLPPYIRRPDERSDRLRYQTVYAKQPGSVAAPTAGLHFTRRMLTALEARDIERVEITLHVSLGTFQPVHETNIASHRLHPETFSVDQSAADALNRARANARRIIAVGTTTVRTLEHVAAHHAGRIEPVTGETELFIQPGFAFQVVGGLLTNFHLPRTTLLMLVAAFAGRELILEAYHHAVRERYRFYSYGDCMLIL
jgi:S-adenosylmethionine:tRNA ribosyltransferase-isomerase